MRSRLTQSYDAADRDCVSSIHGTDRQLVLFVSGNLAAETMKLLAVELSARLPDRVRLVTDGFLLLEGKGDLELTLVDPARAEQWLRPNDLLVSSIRSPGAVERQLIRAARKVGASSVIVLADLGTGPQKFRDAQGWALPDVISIADPLTLEAFVKAEIPEDTLYHGGSPYLDQLVKATVREQSGTASALFFDVPNREDFVGWQVEFTYDEVDATAGFRRACRRLGVNPLIRPHPKQRRPHQRLTSLVDCLGSARLFVSTYSTALVVAKQHGKHAVSFQPGQPQVRANVFAASGIPVAATEADLIRLMDLAFSGAEPSRAETMPRYHEHRSGKAITDMIIGLAGWV